MKQEVFKGAHPDIDIVRVPHAADHPQKQISTEMVVNSYKKPQPTKLGPKPLIETPAQEAALRLAMQDPRLTTFLGYLRGEPITTISVIFGERLPMDDLYHAELNEWRGRGLRRIAEATKQAGDCGTSLSFQMMAVANYFAARRVDAVAFRANPRRRRTYRGFGFTPLASMARLDPTVNGHEAYGMIARLEDVWQQPRSAQVLTSMGLAAQL